MSQDYHHHHPGLFSFSNGFERSPAETLQQIRRDKVPLPQQLEEEDEHPVGLAGSNETSGMLSEMFNFQQGTTARELLESQISHGFHHHHHGQQSQQQMAAAMQLFLMNPSQARSPSPSPPAAAAAASTLHMSSVPNPSPTSTLQGFHTPTGGHFSHFAWGDGGTANAAAAGEGQGLSLSLSSSLQAAKAGEEFRISGDATGMLFFSQGMASAPSEYPCKNNLNLCGGGGGGGGVMDHHHIHHVGFGSSIGVINGLRHSKYAKAAQELLDEFCSVVSGHHQFNKNKPGSLNPNSNPTSSDAVDGGDAPNNNSSSSSKATPPLSTADRIEHQRRKVKLLSMLDEVDRRYNRYCEQMQMVVNSFDLVMGFGAAAPYTVLAQKAMSRHFRCLKDAVAAQLKHSCERLGEKDGGASGLTKGETPRLKMLEQSLRQQRAFHQMGIIEPEAWRPQRGLPERSVNALRAWLFEHFLHPYPSDADKHMLARQTGLSRSQVSNWFINARVRLWKPMVEEMYQQEVKVGDSDENMDSPPSGDDTVAQTPTPNAVSNSPPTTTTVTTAPPPPSAAAAVTATAAGKRSEINAAHESDPSLLAINNTQCFSRNQTSKSASFNAADTCHRLGTAESGKADIGSALVRFGTNAAAAAGNVSLTLGLRHAGNLPDKNHFFG